jgi:hypothetical protein
MKVGQKVYIPKGNAGKGVVGTISHIKTDPICDLIFCEEFTDSLLVTEVEDLNDKLLQVLADTLEQYGLRKHLYIEYGYSLVERVIVEKFLNIMQ